MQKLGQIMNPRDANNWMIPRQGTKRRKIYEALVAGKRASEIMQEMHLSRPAFNSHRRFITSWEKANADSLAVKTYRRVEENGQVTFVEANG